MEAPDMEIFRVLELANSGGPLKKEVDDQLRELLKTKTSFDMEAFRYRYRTYDVLLEKYATCAQQLRHASRLTSLSLGGLILDERVCSPLAASLEKLSGLASLTIDVAFIPGTERDGAKALAEVLTHTGHLSSLRLLRNRILFSDELGQGLAKATMLTSLDLSDTRMTYEETKVLGSVLKHLRPLTSLTLRDCSLEDRGVREIVAGLRQSSSLTSLDLSHNKLRELPTDLGNLPALETLRVDHVEFPPYQVVREGTAAILSFLRQAEREKTRSRPIVKLLFVGPQRVGKSSLFQALKTGEAVPEGTKTTVGADVMFWEWEPEKGGESLPIRFRVFDCAGQKQYGTMQRLFFTTEHCIYVLVFNVSDETTEPRELKERLDSIQAVAPGATFILVGTHRDKVEAADVALQRLKDMHADLKAALSQDLKAIAQYTEIDLDLYIRQPPELWEEPFLVSSTNYWGVRELEEMLIDLVRGDPDSFVRALPRSWVELFDEVGRMQEGLASETDEGADKQVGALLEVRWKDLWQRTDAPGLGFQDGGEFMGALGYMSALGFVLRFPGAPGLKDVVFLHPSWLAHVLGDLFSHTLREDPSLADDQHVEDLVERGLLYESLIPKLPKLRGKGGPIDSGRLLDLIQLLELGYPVPGGGERQCFLPARWQDGRPDMARRWLTAEGDAVRGWRLTSSGRLPAGFFETALVQSGICVAHPPELQWKGGAFIKLDNGISVLVENRGGSAGGACFDILAKAKASEASGAELDARMWKLLSPVIISAFTLHKVAFHGDHRLQYSAACPAHPPGSFLKLTPAVLNEIVKGRYDGELRSSCDAQRSGHVSVPWANIAPNPSEMAEAFQQEEVLAALRRIEQTQRGFPLLIEQAQHALGRLIVETRTNAFPRAFAVHRETLDKITALKSMKATVEEAAKAALASTAGESVVEVRARKFLAVVYNRLMQGLFQDHAKLYLLCEDCFLPQGDGYRIRRKSMWGGRLASVLGILLVLGKLGRLAAPVIGAEALAKGFVKAIDFVKAPLDEADSTLPGSVTAALSRLQSLRHVSKEGLEAFQLGCFLDEHDKDGAWKGLLFFKEAQERVHGAPESSSTSGAPASDVGRSGGATVWVCQACLTQRELAGAAARELASARVRPPPPELRPAFEAHSADKSESSPTVPQKKLGAKAWFCCSCVGS